MSDLDEEKRKLHMVADNLTALDRIHFTTKDSPMDDGTRYQQINIVVEKNINIKKKTAMPTIPRLDPETNLPALPEFWGDDDE